MLSRIMDLHDELTAAWTSANLVTAMGQFCRTIFVTLLNAGRALTPRMRIEDFIVFLVEMEKLYLDRPKASFNTTLCNDGHIDKRGKHL
jgi:hypothetical protein